MADLVSPIVDIISRLWTCCATQTRYLCELQENKNLLRIAMNELKEVRDDVKIRVEEEEADPNEPKRRTEQVRGWLERVHTIEGEVEMILQKADAQLSRARCLGGCCPPNNCCSNYKVGKSIAKKILPLVKDLKVKGDFQELTFIARPTNYLSKLQDNKISLSAAMEELKRVRNDVQRKVVEAEADHSEPKMRTDQVCGWLQSVKNIEGEVEEIMQTSDGLLSYAECREKDKLVVMKKALVGELKEKGNFQELTYRLPPPLVQHMNLESTVGMESMFDKVWKLIVTSKDDDNKGNIIIIGLYGLGGVGKTTLLKKINNEFNKNCGEHGFDHIVMFVVVSKPINYEAIQKKILEKLGLSFQGDGDESSRAHKIFNALRNKNFVILLDDIWERVDLQRIGIPQDNSSSKVIIFTTRSKQVCGLMEATHKFRVECLPWDKAWSLFQEKVGEEALTCFPRALELAKDVAKQCGGLPLALITIGRAMSTSKSAEEWKDAIATLKNSASEFPGMGDDILPRLKLSYDNLRNDTFKWCFRYCALYPEDHKIYIPELIDHWSAEGILNRSVDNNNNLDGARCYGHLVIETLKRACLLESDEGEENHVKMHDIIRDLALWIVNDCSSSSSSNTTTGKFLVASNNYVCERWRNAERIFWIWNPNLEVKEPPTSPNLRTLLLQHRSLKRLNLSLPQSFFQFTPFLRVLDMSYTGLTELPTSICELHELQYLSLSSTKIKELPVELRKLVKLKFLDLSSTTQLKKIPAGVMANLSELQVLKLDHSGFKDWGLKEEEEDGDGGLSLGELDRLKQLQEVTLNISTSLALEELLCNQKLPRICTKLRLESCVNLKSISLLHTSLKYLRIESCVELEELILFINDEGGETNTSSTTTAAGLPISNDYKLERLFLQHLPRLNNIVWGENIAPFQNLYYIYIGDCDALKDLAWLIYVENLKHLYVTRCNGLETIIELGEDDLEEGASGGCRVFRRLKTLTLRFLPNLKSICSHALVFPSIEWIRIIHCNELKKLPLDSRSNINNTLQEIRGEPKWWSELQWEDETIKSKFLPYFQKYW